MSTERYTWLIKYNILNKTDWISTRRASEGAEAQPYQLDRAMKFLRKGHWVIPHVAPGEGGRILVEYRLGKRGTAFLRSFGAFSKDAERRMAALGSSEVAELQSLYR